MRIDRPKLTLDPGETAQIVVNFKPVRHHETAPGEYPVKLVVREESNPAAALEAGIVLRVLPFSGFGAALERHHIGGGERFRLHIHNQGSGELPLSVTSNPLGPVNIVFSTASKLTLGPGQRAIIQGDVKPRQAIIIGQPKDHDFDLVVKSGDAAGFTAAVRGQYQQVALMPVWAPFVVAAALAVVITLAVLLITIISAPRPNIAAFDVQNTRIVRGETLNIEWAVTDVAQLEVLVNGTPAVSDIDPEVGGVALDTTNLPDNAVISLVGTNRGAQVSSEQLVQVAPPLQLTTFIADPPQLVRYVVQPLSLEWEVANAEFTRISGLEALTGVAIGDSFGPEGNVTDLLGIPQNPLVLTIYAESALGTTMTETIRIEVIDPRCTAIGGPVQLYAGPNPANQVVGSVPEATSVKVDAQEEDGGWLRVQLTGGIAGWGPLAAFDCNSTFAPSSLRKVVDVVTPVPSPTVTATETPNLGPTPTTRFETAGTPEPTASG